MESYITENGSFYCVWHEGKLEAMKNNKKDALKILDKLKWQKRKNGK